MAFHGSIETSDEEIDTIHAASLYGSYYCFFPFGNKRLPFNPRMVIRLNPPYIWIDRYRFQQMGNLKGVKLKNI